VGLREVRGGKNRKIVGSPGGHQKYRSGGGYKRVKKFSGGTGALKGKLASRGPEVSQKGKTLVAMVWKPVVPGKKREPRKRKKTNRRNTRWGGTMLPPRASQGRNLFLKKDARTAWREDQMPGTQLDSAEKRAGLASQTSSHNKEPQEKCRK